MNHWFEGIFTTGLRGLVMIGFAGCVFAAGAQGGPGPGGGGGGGRGGAVFLPAPIAAPPAVPWQFSVTGFIQAATLDSTGAICSVSDPKLRGGTVTVNGLKIVIPCNTVLQMPALAVTWAELFSLAPQDTLASSARGTQTGMALQDSIIPVTSSALNPGYSGPLPSYEITVQGNIVDGRYIAGLVFVSQQSLNVGQGLINFIDYTKGEIHVGGTPGVSGPNDVRIRLNDPPLPGKTTGRFGKSHGSLTSSAEVKEAGYDFRFTVDQDNPTVHASTGYPMCIPRRDPFKVGEGDDPDCPMSNRPVAPTCHSLPLPYTPFVMPPTGERCHSFVMDPAPVPGTTPCSGLTCPTDPTRQAPFVIGDFVDYLGTLKIDPATGPYISAHTLAANVGIFTMPGTQPVYTTIEVVLAGTGGIPVANLPQEATTRLKVEGFATDPTMLVDIFAMDLNPYTGAVTDRLLGTADPANPPVVGRFRFVPLAGAFLPPTRNYRVVSRGTCGNNFEPCYVNDSTPTYATGLMAGQYNAPNFEFIFGENRVMGDIQPPANLQDLAFLYCGSGPLTTPTAGSNPPIVGQLNPAPWKAPMFTPAFASMLCPSAPIVGGTAPAPVPAGTIGAPAITTAAVVNTTAGGTVNLFATASDPNQPPMPINFAWQQISGPPVVIVPSGNLGQNITFTAPSPPTPLPATIKFNLTVTNGLAASSSVVTVNVSAGITDRVTINRVTWTNTRLNKGKFSVVASSTLPNTTPGLQLYVQASTDWFIVDPVTNSFTPVTLELAPVPVAMSLVQDSPVTGAALATCPTLDPCWLFSTTGVLAVPDNLGVFMVPQTVTVTSSRGGSTTVGPESIIVK